MGGTAPMVEMTVNWNEEVKPNKYFSIKVGKEEAIINANHLRSIVWLCSNDEERDQIVGARITNLRKIRRNITVKADKNIAKGDLISFMVDFPFNDAIIADYKRSKMAKGNKYFKV